MESIIQVKGEVNFQITLDPTVWIFDDRKLDLDQYFTEKHVEIDADEEYIEKAGKFWSREIMEGATFPPTLKTERKFDRQKMMSGTFGIKIVPFIQNAEPKTDATTVIFGTQSGEQHSFPIEEAKTFIFQFSQEGKMLSQDGPVYLLFNDGSNLENPIKGITSLEVK